MIIEYHAVQHSFARGGRAKLCGIKTMRDQIDYHGWAQTMLNSMIFEYHAVQHDGSSDWDDLWAGGVVIFWMFSFKPGAHLCWQCPNLRCGNQNRGCGYPKPGFGRPNSDLDIQI